MHLSILRQTEDGKKPSYKEFEADFEAFDKARVNFLTKHGAVIKYIQIKPTTTNVLGMTICTVTDDVLLNETYDMHN